MARRDYRMPAVEKYKHLFTPIKIGNTEIRNRICFTTTCSEFVTPDGYSTDQFKAFWAARAKGGTGLLNVGPFIVIKGHKATYTTLGCGLWDDSFLYGYSQVAEAIHYFGGKAIAQLGSGMGRQAYLKDPSLHPYSSSPGLPYYIHEHNLPESMKREFDRKGLGLPLKMSRAGPMADEAPHDFIVEQEDAYVAAALRALEMGYDGVEIHHAHGYYGFSFLSPRLNFRKDEYGGSLENRMRFFMNSLRKVRAAVPDDFLVGIRTSVEEHLTGGLSRDEVKVICKTAESLGATHITFSDGTWETLDWMLPSEPGISLEGVTEIKKELNIPVICPSMDDPDLSEKALAEGKTDLVGFGRGHLADPQWANKVARGERPNRCTRCGNCWVRLIDFHEPLRCVVNPELGFEYLNPEYQMKAEKGIPPCNAACPLKQNVQGAVDLVSRGEIEEAVQLIREDNPLPSILGRVCPHPCEVECNRGEVEEPIAISLIERYIGDWELAHEKGISALPVTKNEKVAVVGSGPAGLMAAYQLAKKGYGATIFEALSVAGGMMAVGIPEYRLPRMILQAEIDMIKKCGVEIKLNSPVGRRGLTIDQLKKQGYRAVFLAVGAHEGMKLNIPGEELEGVYESLSFLRDVNMGKEVKVGKRVVVVGGGDSAFDAARTALRLGAEDVRIIYRRSLDEMPASAGELKEAEQEGVRIRFLAAPVQIIGKNGKVAGIECTKTKLGKPDASGRKVPVPVKGSEFTVDADTITVAIGATADLSFLPSGGKVKASQGIIQVDPVSLATDMPGVFAGGDATRGPTYVAMAMADGKKAAEAIDCYLREETLPTEEVPLINTFDDIGVWNPAVKRRVNMATIPPEQRATSFEEVNLGYKEDEVVEEGKRCLNCLWRIYMPLYRW